MALTIHISSGRIQGFNPRLSLFRASALLALACGSASLLRAADANDLFQKNVEPVLTEFCYDCHADGMNKGKVAFDEFASPEERLQDRDFWWAVLKNLQSHLMPPAKKPQPGEAQRESIVEWIKTSVFQIDPANPDPGQVTLRRLNRVEYQNTIRDLMGIEFKAYEEFPPDDAGYGFDNIGDVLSISPLLMEKYMQAAEIIVARAVPTVTRIVPEQSWAGSDFQSEDGNLKGERLDFYKEARLTRDFDAAKPGTYRLSTRASVHGAFDFDPGRCRVTLRLDDKPLFAEEYKWQDGRVLQHEFTVELTAGQHRLLLALDPLVAESERKTSVDYRLNQVRLEGPLAEEHWAHPFNYQRFFFRDAPPMESGPRREYAREILQRFTTRAFRRPADPALVDKLTAFAEEAYQQPDKTFEAGLARAMVAVLASPRFIFRVEEVQHESAGGLHPLIDEYALASRLSYFLWSTMPDQELFDLASQGSLRKNLRAQVNRLLEDKRSDAFVRNFVGQWLQVRDVEGVSINERVILARDAGRERETDDLFERFRALRAIEPEELTPEQKEELEGLREKVRSRFRGPRVELDGPLRRAMQRETEMVFEHVVRQDRGILELIDSDYTFLNQRLAAHYGIQGVDGDAMRRVELPEDSPRGGVLTHGSVLVVTSNPTRTSPVKRGLFVLDYILGTPAPPPPADVPLLEEAEKEFKDHNPTLREMLELHRSKPLCSSCHSRMDPLGLALENFNALGLWRDKERGQPVDAAGQLITGERFGDIRELKRILATSRHLDFYRCLTEKLLTYALGRGLEDYDVETVDRIVEQLELNEGRFSVLLTGVIESAPFQKRRRAENLTATTPGPNATQIAQQQHKP